MDELVDILDTTGSPTGKTALKSYAHRMGLFHKTVHVWFYTNTGEILLQQRAKNKEIHPLLWDVSVAGHIGAGEAIELSAVREVQEEIGLKILENDLTKIGVFKSIQKHHDKLIDCEFHHTFLCTLHETVKNLRKQKSEVADLKLIPLRELEKQLLEIPDTFVPHDQVYYETIISEIEKHL